jgi:hypothetical protein
MPTSDKLLCELCGSEAIVVTVTAYDLRYRPTVQPKTRRTSDGLLVSIECPNCGQREQCIATPEDEDFAPSKRCP